jgi:hypothetical protein
LLLLAQGQLLAGPVVLLPDAPQSADWKRLLEEYQVVLGPAAGFKLMDHPIELWNYCAGLKRKLRSLLVLAYRKARSNGVSVMLWDHVIKAFESDKYSVAREDVNRLIACAGQSGDLRQDLRCPFDGPEIRSKTEVYAAKLREARRETVSNAAILASMNAQERRAVEEIQRAAEPQAGAHPVREHLHTARATGHPGSSGRAGQSPQCVALRTMREGRDTRLRRALIETVGCWRCTVRTQNQREALERAADARRAADRSDESRQPQPRLGGSHAGEGSGGCGDLVRRARDIECTCGRLLVRVRHTIDQLIERERRFARHESDLPEVDRLAEWLRQRAPPACSVPGGNTKASFQSKNYHR